MQLRKEHFYFNYYIGSYKQNWKVVLWESNDVMTSLQEEKSMISKIQESFE